MVAAPSDFQAGVSAFLTPSQKSRLGEMGYTAEQIADMKPADGHRVLGLAGERTPENAPAEVLLAAAPVALIDLITKVQRPAQEPISERAQAAARRPDAHRDDAIGKYATAALNNQAKKVSQAGSGIRNQTLNDATLSLGHLVGAGALAESDVRAAMEAAAAACGLVKDDGIGAVRATITSALRAGIADPADLSKIGRRSGRPPGSGGSGDGGSGNGGLGGPGNGLNRDLAFYPQTDLGNAERFCERNKGHFIWTAERGWLWWTGKHWSRSGADAEVSKAAHRTVRAIQDEAKAIRETADDKVMGTRGKGAEKTDVMLSDLLSGWGRQSEQHARLNALEEEAKAYLHEQISKFDADPFCINVANGTLFIRKPGDVRTSSPLPGRAADVQPDGYIYFLPHDPGDLCTKISPVDYVPGAPCDRFQKFLTEVQPDFPMRRQLAAWKGYSLTGDTSEQSLCVDYGTGRNGKTVWADVTSYVAGDYADTTSIRTFLQESRNYSAGQPTPHLAKLTGVRMLRTSEPEKGARLNESLIKDITGGDPIEARDLHKPPFTFYPAFKVTINANHKPKIKSADEGIWSRVVLVPWSVYLPVEKRIKHLSKMLRKEASGILNWMLSGLQDWLDNGLLLTKETQEATAKYRCDSDQLGRFLEVCTERVVGESVQSSVLLGVFNAWSVANSLDPWTRNKFSDEMNERYPKSKVSVMFYEGLRLTKKESDFVDHIGQPIIVDGGS